MEIATSHNLSELFKQLGLPNSDMDILDFIEHQPPLSNNEKIHQAKCWNREQSDFLEFAIAVDADWSDAVDHLDNLLR